MKSFLLLAVVVVIGFLVAGIALQWLVGMAWNVLVVAGVVAVVLWGLRRIFGRRKSRA